MIDSVYMFMWSGWRKELRSNRWHFGTRWAKRFPVVMIQPDLSSRGEPFAEPDGRIPNCEILSVHQTAGPDRALLLGDAFVQAGQIAKHQLRRNHKKPLFWLYNPYLLGSYALLPSAVRVLHATENYFDFENMSDLFLTLHLRALEASRCVVAVSDGVAESIRARVPKADVLVSTNGCDYDAYGPVVPGSRAIEALRSGFDRLVIYAGNVNARIDFSLVRSCAREYPKSVFVFVGPVAGLDRTDAAAWAELLALPNVRATGPVDPDELPAVYRAADVGIIPYRRTTIIERSGFPLKALEMAATELPVVSTWMKPLEDVRDALFLAPDEATFIDAIRGRSRSTLSAAERSRIGEVCRSRSYDRRFEEVSSEVMRRATAPTTIADVLPATLSQESWTQAVARLADSGGVIAMRQARRRILARVPARLKGRKRKGD